MHDAGHSQKHIPDDEGSWQEVDELEGLGIFVFQDDACLARMFHLTEKRTEFDSSFVKDERIGEESATVTVFENPGTQVDVFAITHGCETSQSLVNALLDAEVEAARVEFIHLPLATTDATCGEK